MFVGGLVLWYRQRKCYYVEDVDYTTLYSPKALAQPRYLSSVSWQVWHRFLAPTQLPRKRRAWFCPIPSRLAVAEAGEGAEGPREGTCPALHLLLQKVESRRRTRPFPIRELSGEAAPGTGRVAHPFGRPGN